MLRIYPMNAVFPSPFAFFLRKGPVPFVIGPLNGGLPYVPGFSQAENQKQWISSLRNLYRFLPFARSTFRNAAAIIAASSQTCAEFIAYREKSFFVPENGIAQRLCFGDTRSPDPSAKLELIFVGGLIPCKACDLGLRAAAPLLRNDLAHFTIVGDGPERGNLEQLARSLGIEKAVSFCGWVSHEEVLRRLRSADVMVFPSVRDFGAGVVFEALATGAVPVVADFGGPGDIVHPEVGFKVPLTNESDFVAQMEKILTELAHDRDRLRAVTTAGNGLCAGTPNLGCEGTGHYASPALGRGGRTKARSSATKGFSWVDWISRKDLHRLPAIGVRLGGSSESPATGSEREFRSEGVSPNTGRARQ